MKPEPLDLEDIKNKVIEEIEKEINIFNKQEEEKGRWFSDYYKKYGEPIQTGLIWHRGYEERLEICPYLKKKFNKLVKEITQRLKSAVEGLKKEIENKKIDTAKLQNPEEIISMTKKELANEVNIEIDEILLTIKKWFPDVLEEVKE